MKTFLDYIIDDIPPNDLKSLHRQCFVFPSQRACLYFSEGLKSRFPDQTFFSPEIHSIEEFVVANAQPLILVNELTLLMNLFECYRQTDANLTFDRFYSWGRVLLHDFDEIDRYLVDTRLIFKNLQDLQDINQAFGPDEAAIEAVRAFQDVIENSEGEVSTRFLETWATVGKVYPLFVERLKNQSLAYPGMCYRFLAESLAADQYDPDNSMVIFCGFNAMTKAEQTIISCLLHKSKAKVYLDADCFYLDSPQQGAGAFLRQLKQQWSEFREDIHWITHRGIENLNNISFVAAQDKIAQAQAATALLAKGGEVEKTAIVLADESLLKPLLYALPAHDQPINVTMGYPVSDSLYASLFELILKYQMAFRETKNGIYVDKASFRTLLTHPLIHKHAPQPLVQLTKGKSTWVYYESVIEASGQSQILVESLSHRTKPLEVLNAMVSLVLSLHEANKQEHSPDSGLQEQLTYTLVKYLAEIRDTLAGPIPDLALTTLAAIIRQGMRTLRASLVGEPLAGLQIMGFLETRVLDFKNIIILSVNEGILPSGDNTSSFLPFGIRKAFQMPTFLDQDNIYAYHFFRLLQRSEKIHIIYNTQMSFDGSGEMSRFVLQLKHYLSAKQIKHYLASPALDINLTKTSPIVVQKVGPVLDEVKNHIQTVLSPTALIDYVHCPLKYYLGRIKKIRPPYLQEDHIDARIFGNLLHAIIQDIYKPFIGKTLDKNTISDLKTNILPKIVSRHFEEYRSNGPENGEFTFNQHVIHHIIRKILTCDEKDAPITILDLESEKMSLSMKLQVGKDLSVRLGGRIDRIDQINHNGGKLVRIIDYKTGKFQFAKLSRNRVAISDKEYIEKHYSEPDYKSGFQTLFYALLYNKNHPDDPVTGGVFGARSLSSGLNYLSDDQKAIPVEWLREYEKQLSSLVLEIVDCEKPFVQTEKLKRCTYCEFKTICGR